ncbi:hypothetical protein F2Q68_00008690 [Brassica cretica]|uniref:Ribosomal protein L10e/L16 domain-containing protein n=1 Tax=Brassica cretica TaxID=69181 RepID=A0A8S9KSF3_BRACR|nr:hypothetical protein F2Q68_00008690 [Brassica cretica]
MAENRPWDLVALEEASRIMSKLCGRLSSSPDLVFPPTPPLEAEIEAEEKKTETQKRRAEWILKENEKFEAEKIVRAAEKRRVAIGQVLLSVRCKDNHGAHAQEALRRAKFKFPGRQKIIVSRKWGFTKFNRADYTRLRQSKRIVPDGVNAKVLFLYLSLPKCIACVASVGFLSNHGRLANRQPGSAFISATSD